MSTCCRHLLSILIPLLLGISLPAQAQQEFDWAPNYPVGSSIPMLEAPDQNGEVQTLDSLTGTNGLLLMFSRSFDWCPFCKAQLDALGEVSDQFEAMGINIATITYDSIETLKLAEEDFDVDFSLLQDEAIKHVNAFGIRNMDYSPGDFGYGIPLPGIFLLSPEGVVRYKFAEENYRDRPDWTDVLEAAEKMAM